MRADDYCPSPKRPGFFATLFGVIAGIDMASGIMATIMYTTVNLEAIKAAVAWIDGGCLCLVRKRRHQSLSLMLQRKVQKLGGVEPN